MSPSWYRAHRDTFHAVLANALASDAYECTPLPSEVFFGPRAFGSRTIRGTMPHYGLYHGPMHYRVVGQPNGWHVEVRFAVELPEGLSVMQLPDCALSSELEGPVQCVGIPFSQANSLEACPSSGTFRATTTPRNLQALLRRWSQEPERYYQRDARAFNLPIHYDFSFEAVSADTPEPVASDLRIPIGTTCARTPYFLAMRSGWSMPVVAHEIGHVLGLLDEYEMFSGIVSFYPKTPFPGADQSRMGLSMREETVVLPLHHYLILRRFFCPEPPTRDPYDRVFRP
ncbi:MAG: hypothetical protein MUF54_13510 [Polyangiaceae bacterium]|nr:hypothetical protein [Polyangiaceae bacterium]